MKGKLIKYRDNWAVEFKTEQQGENSWFNRLELEPSINSDKYKDLKMVEILNVPIVELEGKEVEFDIVTEYARLNV
jgi:hypothetical protein